MKPGLPPRARSAVDRLRGGELGGLAGDSVSVGVWQAATSVADLLQIALITHALGLTEYGRLALVIAFVTLVGQFFDVRVGTAATTFGARKLDRSTPRAAAGVFQLSYAIDVLTGVVGFAVVAALSPVVGPSLVGDEGVTLIVVYALTLLASTVDESSLTVLRLLGRFRLIAAYTVAVEALRIGLVAAAVVLFDDLTGVVLALLLYEILAGAANAVAATGAFRRASDGVRLTRRSPGLARAERREMLGMVMHTSVVSYARLAQVQLPTIVVGAIAGATQAGLYKVGTAAATIVGRLADPPYAALLPRISRLWAGGRRAEVRRLVGRASLVSAPALALAFTVVVILQTPILDAIGGGAAEAASAVLVLAALAQAVNGALFWNLGVLYVAGRSRLVAVIAIASAATQLLLLSVLVPTMEATGAGVAFLVSMVGANVAITWAALRALTAAPSREHAHR